MHDTKKPPLNQGQQAAADGFFEFLFGDKKELIISGPGGVGKTFLMGHLIDEIMPRYFETCKLMGIPHQYHDVKMTATTNKAADVLGAATLRPADTIHSFLNLKVKDNFHTGRSTLLKTNAWQVNEGKILFVDESSMIDTPLRNMILEGTHKSKIIYVGDHCQLAPVMETLSPIYSDNLPFFELTEPMRTGDKHLQALNQQLRNAVETGEFHPIQIVPGVIDWLDDAEMEQAVQQSFLSGNTDNRIVAYTNKRVIEFNDHIRQIRNLPPSFTQGEVLVNNSAVRIGKSMLSVEEEVVLLELSDDIEEIEIACNVVLHVRRATLSTALKGIFQNVLLPVDQNHFAQLIKWFSQQKNWERYFHLKNTYPDLRQRDAATVHKVQGSSHDTIFIDATNISTCHQPNTAARLLYVAATRARHRVVFYGELASKYGGLVR